MRARMRALFFTAVFAVGASVILGSAAPARGEELFRYSSGALAGGGNSGRGRYPGLPRGQANYQVPGAVAGYWRGDPQPAYPVPAPNPTPAAGYRYDSPQAIYQVPAASRGTITGYWHHYPAR
ncbi:hypothetical protein SAMN05444166_3866 [Singulisphaera sp. GP187]|uniref:hypothetical protein n=1 Tax=Singulisphaera sp. GP187 TaxID=1882752 RepID=UPI00092CD904|nr:hypothetical protein [Singulisphaera sp. GP187]SIO33425.1 hypothetical protein SAMN05444166_3866 [Singulisphaera sp. GP187]